MIGGDSEFLFSRDRNLYNRHIYIRNLAFKVIAKDLYIACDW